VEQQQWEVRVRGATSDWALQAAQRGLAEKQGVNARLQAALRALDTAVTGLGEPGLTGLRQGRAAMDFVVLQAVDPNELLGPEGFGPLRFVGVQGYQFYQVNFENLPAATAYSRQVEIVDALPAGLDPRTVELKDIRFGSYHLTVPPGQSFYQNRIRLGPELNDLWAEVVVTLDLPNRKLRWRLTALDPATGMMPTDPQQGLLPPNDAMQNGRGSVTFTVRARNTYATGTRIQNQALIVFDNNEPLETTPVWNTLDTGMPASAVLTATSMTEGGDVTLTWDGADDSGGSGVKSYDIYVSDNGGPYQLWLTGDRKSVV
jgi:large repetitive protein